MREMNLTVKQTAQLMDKSEQFIRIGLQSNIFPFGHAVKLSTKWTYHISRHNRNSEHFIRLIVYSFIYKW